jgi:hypothetical protein
VSVDEPTPTVDDQPARRRTRRVRRGPILFVVLVAVVAAVIAQQRAPSDTGTPAALAAAASARADVGVPPADVASSAWYCAAGTSSADGKATETVDVASVAQSSIAATITVMPGGDATPATHTVRLAPGEEVHVPVADVLATAEPGVLVETIGGPAVVSHVLEHDDDVAVEACTRTAATDWYFASGTTVDGSDHDLLLFNPFGDDAIVDISFVTDTGVQEPAQLQALVVPRRSRITVPVQDSVLRQARVATHVHARSGRIVAEQTEAFDNVTVDGAARKGIALSAGATEPATTWRIATGSTRGGGHATLSVANFSGQEAHVGVHVVMVNGTKLPEQAVTVASQGVERVDVTTRVPLDTDYAVVVDSHDVDGQPVPVVAELQESWAPTSSTTGLAGTLGSTVTARRWVVPQPDVDADSFLTIYNPGTAPVTAAMLPANQVDRSAGPVSEPEVAIPAGGAKTVRLSLLPNRRAAAVLTADHPVVVGLTVLGNAGAAISAAVPDLTYAG